MPPSPDDLSRVYNVAVSYRRVQKGESISLKMQGGFARKIVSAPAILYEDSEGNEMLVMDSLTRPQKDSK